MVVLKMAVAVEEGEAAGLARTRTEPYIRSPVARTQGGATRKEMVGEAH